MLVTNRMTTAIAQANVTGYRITTGNRTIGFFSLRATQRFELQWFISCNTSDAIELGTVQTGT